ncbi:hypothetical protein F5B17DRAFT_303059 [Nemania serpens]|nr:hypothetical protein F5B17DRAFT_303059 [Nemania serpens]
MGKQRKGLLSLEQRTKAALMRKLRACDNCRRRRVSCQPEHRNMSWEEAMKMHEPSSQHQDLATHPNRSSSSTVAQTNSLPTPTTQVIIIDPAPISQTARGRKALPTNPRPIEQLPLPSLTKTIPLSSKPCYRPLEVTTTLPSDNDDSSQILFPARNRSKFDSNRKRRIGPLSATQRLKAALMRKVGACKNCRTCRHPCQPEHHNMSWEEAMNKHQPLIQGLATQPNRSGDPTTAQTKSSISPSSKDMEIYSTTTVTNQQNDGLLRRPNVT